MQNEYVHIYLLKQLVNMSKAIEIKYYPTKH